MNLHINSYAEYSEDASSPRKNKCNGSFLITDCCTISTAILDSSISFCYSVCQCMALGQAKIVYGSSALWRWNNGSVSIFRSRELIRKQRVHQHLPDLVTSHASSYSCCMHDLHSAQTQPSEDLTNAGLVTASLINKPVTKEAVIHKQLSTKIANINKMFHCTGKYVFYCDS